MKPTRPTDHLLWQTPTLTVGRFFAPPDHPRFNNSGPIQQHLFALPRTSVWIQHEARPPFVSAPNQVNFYNRRQRYRRLVLGEAGDLCHWFAPDPEVVLEVVRKVDPSVDERPDRPFSFPFVRAQERAILLGRQLTQYLEAPTPNDALLVEEATLTLLDRLIRGSAAPAADPKDRHPAHYDLVETAKALLTQRYAESMALGDLAERCGVSISHLCRVFRQQTGTTIHAYRHRLRLLAALDRLDEAAGDLTSLALDLGFSSHSHFTAAFHEAFDTTPSALWRIGTTETLQRLSRNPS